mgnify:FL=1|jgi:hypothetical protein
MNVQPKTPIGEIRFLQIPLDNSYTDTLRFTDMPAQYSYFESLSGITIDGFTEVRTVNTDTIRVPVNSDELSRYNYIMFKNANYNDKWWFAFITGLEYVSPSMTLVTFEIDVMQSWQFEWLLRDCFVEREHTTTDIVGDAIIDEELETGDFVYSDADGDWNPSLTEMSIVVAASFTFDAGSGSFEDAKGGMYSNIYSGLHYNVFDTDTEGILALNNFLNEATKQNKSEGIASIFMCPKFVTNTFNAGSVAVSNLTANLPLTLDGYTPRCYKMYTYPYSFWVVTNNEGLTATLKVEFFENQKQLRLGCWGSGSASPVITMVPLGYKNQDVNYQEKMNISNYPQCAYTIDTFKAWTAMHGEVYEIQQQQNLISTITAAANTLLSLTSGSVSGVLGGAYGVASSVNDARTALARKNAIETKADQVRGTGSGSANISLSIKGFNVYHYTVSKEYAKIIDDFLWAYGYAVNEIKTPNLDSRKYWNFIKTQGCKLGGYLPFNDAAKIKSIFDNGITFWHVNDGIVQVGNYSFDNSPSVKGFREDVVGNGEEQKQAT